MTDAEIERIVTDVLAGYAPEAGFLGAAVKSAVDYDGSDIIRVIARYRTRPNVKPDRLVSAVHAVRAALLAKGETRFVFLSNQVESERPVEADVE